MPEMPDMPDMTEVLASIKETLPNIDLSNPEELRSAIEGCMDTIGQNAETIYHEAGDLVWKVIWPDGALSGENIEQVFQNLQQAASTQLEGLKGIIPDDLWSQFTTGIEEIQNVATEQAWNILNGIKSLTPEWLSGAFSDLSETLTPFLPSLAGLGWAAAGIPYLGLGLVGAMAGAALIKKMRSSEWPAMETVVA